MSLPDLRVEVAFAADPLDATYAKGVCNGSANSYFSTPDAASLDVAGDLDVVARVAMTDWTPTAEQTIAAKWTTTSNQRSWKLSVLSTGVVRLSWSANGSASTDIDSTVAPTFTNGTTYWVRATLDVANGSAGYDVQFFTASDREIEPLAWTALGSTVTTAGTAALFDSSAALTVGAIDAGGSAVLAGDVHRVLVRNGIGGTVVGDFNPAEAVSASSTSWGATRVSSQTWSVGSAASLSVSPTWTDITPYVRDESVRISRGKQSEIATYATSRLSLTLSNRDRRFDPEYAGAYYPNVKPRKRIRVRGTYAGATYTLWTGFVESWPQRYPATNFDATVELTAYDTLGLLADTVLEDAAYTYFRYELCASLNPVSQFATLRVISKGALRDDLRPTSIYVFKNRVSEARTSDGLAVGRSSSILLNDSSIKQYWSVMSLGYPGGTLVGSGLVNDHTLSVWADQTNTAEAPIIGCFETSGDVLGGSGTITTYHNLYLSTAGNVVYQYWNGVSVTTVTGTGTYRDGNPHQITITRSGTPNSSVTVVRIYVDGVLDSESTGLAFGLNYGFNVIGYKPGASTSFLGTVSDIYYANKVLTAAEIATFYKLQSGEYEESTEARANRLLTLAGVPTGLRAISDIMVGVVSDIDTYGSTALSALQKVADSESGGGRLFCDVRGRVTMHDRYWWQSSPRGANTQATFSDDLADLYYVEVSADRSLREVTNEITVSGSQNLSDTVTNSASITAYGTRSGSVSTLLSTQDQVTNLATGLVALRKDPVTRLDAITIRPAMQDSAWAPVLRLELGDRVVHELMPARGVASTSQIARTMLVERLDWSITASDWTLELTGSPIPTMVLFQLDSSTLNGTNVLGF